MNNGSNDFAKNLINARARRCSATILTWLENNVYEYLPEDLHRFVRKTILDNVSDLGDLAADIVKSDTAGLNEFFVEALTDIKSDLRDIHARL